MSLISPTAQRAPRNSTKIHGITLLAGSLPTQNKERVTAGLYEPIFDIGLPKYITKAKAEPIAK
jgi:hypothetical protein